jgi:hypothetical protein
MACEVSALTSDLPGSVVPPGKMARRPWPGRSVPAAPATSVSVATTARAWAGTPVEPPVMTDDVWVVSGASGPMIPPVELRVSITRTGVARGTSG